MKGPLLGRERLRPAQNLFSFSRLLSLSSSWIFPALWCGFLIGCGSPTLDGRSVKDPSLPCPVDLHPFYHKLFHLPEGKDSSYQGYFGRKIIDGLPFDVDGDLRLYGKENAFRNRFYPMATTGIPIAHKFDELHLIHAAEWRTFYGGPVATIRLHYADNSQTDFPVRFNFQVNDWSRLFTEDQEILNDPETKVIWRGLGGAEGFGRLFKTKLANPFPDKQVVTMDAISTHSDASYVLVAVTIAQYDPKRPITPPLPTVPPRHFDGLLNVLVFDASTGQPLSGAEVYPSMVIGDIYLVADPVLTGADGVAQVRYPKNRAQRITLKICKVGFRNDLEYEGEGWNGNNAPPDVTCLMTPGRDPSLQLRRVFGRWKPGNELDNTVDLSQIYHPFLIPKSSTPLAIVPGSIEDSAIPIHLRPRGSFDAENVPPGEYLISMQTMVNHAEKKVILRSVQIPENPGDDADEPVDLGKLDLLPPDSQNGN